MATPAEARPGAALRDATLDNGLKVLDPGGAHRAAGVGLVLVQGRLEGRTARADRRVALGRAHELQGHDQHPARPGEGHHRAVRRQLERLHLDRSDDLSRDRDAATRSIACCSSSPSGWRSCLYDPDDCESERTVIISELQGGENDPDQLLDQELTATAFKAHPYRHPTIGWLSDLQTMTRDDLYGYYRRYYVPNNATLVIVGDVDTDEALRQRRAALRRHPAGPAPARVQHRRARADRRAPRDDSQGRHDGVSEGRLPRAGGRPTPRFFPLLVLDAVLTGAKGLNLWSSFRVPPPQRSARLYRALVETRAGVVGVAARCCRPSSRSSTRCRRRRPKARRWRRSRRRCSRSSIACARDGITDAELDEGEGAAARAARLRQRQRHQHRAPARLLRDHRERRRLHGAARAHRGGDARRGRATRRATSSTPSNRTIGWFEPLPVGSATLNAQRSRLTMHTALRRSQLRARPGAGRAPCSTTAPSSSPRRRTRRRRSRSAWRCAPGRSAIRRTRRARRSCCRA